MNADEQQPCQRCGAGPGQPHLHLDDDCALPHSHSKPRHPPRASIGHACRGCVDRLRDDVVEIGDLYSELAAVVPLNSIPDDTADHKHTKRDGSPAQMRLDAWALAHPELLNAKLCDPDGNLTIDAYLGAHLPDIPDTLTNIAQAVYDAHDWTDTAPDTVSGAVAVIIAAGGVEALTAQPDVDTFDAEIAWMRRVLKAAHGLSEPQPLFDCLEVGCGGHVWEMTGKQNPTCDRCGRRYGTLDWVRARGQELPERRRLRSHIAGNGGRP